MTSTQQHPEIKPHNRIKCRNACSAASQEISCIVCTWGSLPYSNLYVPKFNYSYGCPFQLSSVWKKQYSSFGLNFKASSPSGFALWAAVPCRRVHKICCGQLESRKRNSCCVSVKQANKNCHFSLHFRHESVSQWGRQNTDSTGNQFLNQIITISSAGEELVVCHSKVDDWWQGRLKQILQEIMLQSEMFDLLYCKMCGSLNKVTTNMTKCEYSWLEDGLVL